MSHLCFKRLAYDNTHQYYEYKEMGVSMLPTTVLIIFYNQQTQIQNAFGLIY